jgi:hypothetical protein
MEAAVQAVQRAARGFAARIVVARRRSADARAQAICPTDSWAFTPLYTDGACPLCGWAPEGYVHTPPPLTPYVRYWSAMGWIAALSVVMCVIVVFTVSHT